MAAEEKNLRELTEDVADLQALVAQLMSATIGTEQAAAEANAKDGQDQPDDGPMFILGLADEDFELELGSLSIWVASLLVPVYVVGHEISPSAPWCPTWWEHEEAVARLHALWLAWQELTPRSAGLTGPSVWHRDHLEPCMAALRAPDGPFASCMTRSERPGHRLQPDLAPEAYVPELVAEPEPDEVEAA